MLIGIPLDLISLLLRCCSIMTFVLIGIFDCQCDAKLRGFIGGKCTELKGYVSHV